jgi:hypothetical protein
MKKLVDWFAKHQTVENPLKFSQFDECAYIIQVLCVAKGTVYAAM